MFTTPPAPRLQALKEHLALGGGPVPPDIVERPPLRLAGLPFPTLPSSGIPWTPRSRQPITNRHQAPAYLVETSLSVLIYQASIPTLLEVLNMAADKWFMTAIEQTLTDTGYTIVIQTDVPSHLWMRWTVIPPQEHLIQRTKRGLPLMLEKYYCFDAYHDNEQEEAGDTLAHTFIKEPWPHCETRYFYFHGEIASVPSLSTTAILKKHRVAPEYQLACTSTPLLAYWLVAADGAAYSIPFKPTSSYSINRVIVGFRAHGIVRPPPAYCYIRIYNTLPSNCPTGAPLCQDTVTITLPNTTDYFPHTANFSPTPLIAGKTYGLAILIPYQCTPPGYCRLQFQEGKDWTCPPDSNQICAAMDPFTAWFPTYTNTHYYKTFKAP